MEGLIGEFPAGLLLGGNFSIGDYLMWNETQTVVGNLVGGLVFVWLALYATHVRISATRNRPHIGKSASGPR